MRVANLNILKYLKWNANQFVVQFHLTLSLGARLKWFQADGTQLCSRQFWKTLEALASDAAITMKPGTIAGSEPKYAVE